MHATTHELGSKEKVELIFLTILSDVAETRSILFELHASYYSNGTLSDEEVKLGIIGNDVAEAIGSLFIHGFRDITTGYPLETLKLSHQDLAKYILTEAIISEHSTFSKLSKPTEISPYLRNSGSLTALLFMLNSVSELKETVREILTNTIDGKLDKKVIFKECIEKLTAIAEASLDKPNVLVFNLINDIIYSRSYSVENLLKNHVLVVTRCSVGLTISSIGDFRTIVLNKLMRSMYASYLSSSSDSFTDDELHPYPQKTEYRNIIKTTIQDIDLPILDKYVESTFAELEKAVVNKW